MATPTNTTNKDYLEGRRRAKAILSNGEPVCLAQASEAFHDGFVDQLTKDALITTYESDTQFAGTLSVSCGLRRPPQQGAVVICGLDAQAVSFADFSDIVDALIAIRAAIAERVV